MNESRVSVMSCGLGTNTAAMMAGAHERGQRPDLILFADTGGERPEIYEYRDILNAWCKKVGFPAITTVSESITLEQDCLNRNALPGIVYGRKSCSEHFKTRPQKRWLRDHGYKNFQFWVGIDAGESHRRKYEGTRYPLIEWDWGRDECIAAIQRAGLPQPGKSACFFCPASKPWEILELKRLHPDLLERALAMEAGAELTAVKGLARSWAWQDLVKFDKDQMKLFSFVPDISCECLDG